MEPKAKKNITFIATALLLGALFCLSVIVLLYRTTVVTSVMIAEDVQKLANIFKKIHADCTIIDFDYQKNRINFLNTIAFVGSEVGPLNLKHPENWKGPYMDDNPTMQTIEYEVIRTKSGYYIAPGQGVKLPNGKEVGKDIVLDEHADIDAMMNDESQLKHQGKALAAPVPMVQELPMLPSP